MATQWIAHVEEGELFLPYRGSGRLVYLVGGLNVSLPDALKRFDGRACEMRVLADGVLKWSSLGDLCVLVDESDFLYDSIHVGGISVVEILTQIRAGASVRIELTVAPDDETRLTASEWVSRLRITTWDGEAFDGKESLLAKVVRAAPTGIDAYMTEGEFREFASRVAKEAGYAIAPVQATRRAPAPVPEWMVALFALMDGSEMHGADYGEDFEIRFRWLSEDESMALSDRADAMAIELGFDGWRDAHRASEGGDD